MKQYLKKAISFEDSLPGTSIGVASGFSAGVLLMAAHTGDFWKIATIMAITAILATILGSVVGAIALYRGGDRT